MTSPPRRDLDDGALVSALAQARNPLTVASVQAQLLRRRIEVGQIQDAHACLSALIAIEESTICVELALQDIEAIASTSRPTQI